MHAAIYVDAGITASFIRDTHRSTGAAGQCRPICQPHSRTRPAARFSLGISLAFKLRSAPERYRVNSAYIPRRLTEQPLSTLSGLARLSRQMRECETQFQLLSLTCASLREALPWHRQGADQQRGHRVPLRSIPLNLPSSYFR